MNIARKMKRANLKQQNRMLTKTVSRMHDELWDHKLRELREKAVAGGDADLDITTEHGKEVVYAGLKVLHESRWHRLAEGRVDGDTYRFTMVPMVTIDEAIEEQ